jgi:Holliday junction DNA helicase RuvA
MSTYDKLPREGEQVTLLTHLCVREDNWQLYGFASTEERALFRLLMSVSGIGPRLALNVLSCMPVRAFCETILNADIKALSRISGIGKRSAERLVVELREKVEDISPEAALGHGPAEDTWSRDAQDAVTALETLGFKSEAARKAVQKVLEQETNQKPSAENLIRKALAVLNS